MISLLGGVFLGWSLGANDAANVFGTAVASRMVRFWTAALIAAFFVLLGAAVSGGPAIETLAGLTHIDMEQAVVSSVAAAMTVTAMTVLGLPVSTSQAVIGAILGIGVLNRQMDFGGLGKVVACWFGTPLGAAVIAIVLYKLLAHFYNHTEMNLFASDRLFRSSLIAAGAYGAYSLGANNVANVTAVFVDAGMLTVGQASVIGGASIALGILTFSRPVMETVGKKLVRLDAFSALIVVLTLAITLHIYTVIGVPVSCSHATIGGVLGIGIVRGINTVDRKKLYHILAAWFFTPLLSCAVSLLIFFVIHLRYIPN